MMKDLRVVRQYEVKIQAKFQAHCPSCDRIFEITLHRLLTQELVSIYAILLNGIYSY